MRLSELSTDRLRLEPVAQTHAAGLYPLFDNWEVVRWLSGPVWPASRDQFDAWAARAERATGEGDEAHAAIIHEQRPIGVIGINRRIEARNIGYWLGQPAWSRGLMSEAAEMMLRWFFGAHDDFFVISGAFEGNAASLRVQAKLGFATVGESMIHAVPHGRRLGHIDTMLGREAWRRRQNSAGALI